MIRASEQLGRCLSQLTQPQRAIAENARRKRPQAPSSFPGAARTAHDRQRTRRPRHACAEDTDLVRRFFEDVWNKNDANAAKAIVHDNYSSTENIEFPSMPGPQIVAKELGF